MSHFDRRHFHGGGPGGGGGGGGNGGDYDDDDRSVSSNAIYLRMKADLARSDEAEAAAKREEEEESKKYHISQRNLGRGGGGGSRAGGGNPYARGHGGARSMSPTPPPHRGGGPPPGGDYYGRERTRNDYRAARSMSPTNSSAYGGDRSAYGGGGSRGRPPSSSHRQYSGDDSSAAADYAARNIYAAARDYKNQQRQLQQQQQQRQQQQQQQQQRGRNAAVPNNNMQRQPSARSLSPVRSITRPTSSNRFLPNKSKSFQRDETTGTYLSNPNVNGINASANQNYQYDPQQQQQPPRTRGYSPPSHDNNNRRYREDLTNTAHAHYTPPSHQQADGEDNRKPAPSYSRNNSDGQYSDPPSSPSRPPQQQQETLRSRYRDDLNASAQSPYVPPSLRQQTSSPSRSNTGQPLTASATSSAAGPNNTSVILRGSKRDSTASLVSDISECRSVYGDGLPIWGNHIDDEAAGAVPPSKEQQAAMTIEIQPGFSLPLRGADETTRAIQVNFIVKLNCMVCTLEIQCIGDAEYILCPVCRSVSPIDGNTGNNGGVGLGLQVDV